MNRTIDERYFNYLQSLIKTPNPNREGYTDLLRLMFDKQFVWLVPNDDNRIADGLDVRTEWLTRKDSYLTGIGSEPCSFLEVMIGLSRRISFMAGQKPEGWAWQLLVNLELDRMRDNLTNYKMQKVDDILETVIWRTYNPDGSGGFFPLTHPKEDQRKVELWYQMSSYVEEIHPEY